MERFAFGRASSVALAVLLSIATLDSTASHPAPSAGFGQPHGAQARGPVTDPDGNRSGITYPTGSIETLGHDRADRVVQIKDWLGHSSTFGYDANSNLARETYPNRTTPTRPAGPSQVTEEPRRHHFGAGARSRTTIRHGDDAA